jgi:tRNA(Ile2) C34 agmatinyltransferase TiaS
VEDERPPICPRCGVTMLPAGLSARDSDGDWVCVECEESGDAED